MTPNERRLTALLRAAFSDYTAYTADNLNVRHRRRPDEEAKKPTRPPRPSERGGGGIGSRLANLRRS